MNFDSFIALAEHLLRTHSADALISCPGTRGEHVSLLGIAPVDEMTVRAETPREAIRQFCFETRHTGPALGFLSYTYGLGLRDVHSAKPTTFPHGLLRKYATVLEHDHSTDTLTVHGTQIDLPENPAPRSFAMPPTGPVQASMSQHEYEAGVAETLERIRDGWTYQLNLSMRFSTHCPNLDAVGMFIHLARNNPAPFYGWFQTERYCVLSTSPERFLRVQEGTVVSQPIKGTLRFSEYDDALVRSLQTSPKEDAELSMIVDLIRNDISANCVPGSVHVPEHKSVFAVDDLLQMYSTVTGELQTDRDCIDLLLDAFPGGSITGCPKQSSMRIIDELEPHCRDLYCGSLLKIDGPRDMDSSIAIRTALYDKHTEELSWYAGSGIVVDSNPHAEYLETMAKAGKFHSLIDGEASKREE